MTVQRLDVTHPHTRGLESGHDPPVLKDQWLIQPTADKEQVRDAPRPLPIAVHELHYRVENFSTAVIGSPVGEYEGPRHQHQRSVGARRPVRSRQCRNRPKTDTKKNATGTVTFQGEFPFKLWQQLLLQEVCVLR